MKPYILLCDENWQIERILSDTEGFHFKSGMYLTDFVSDSAILENIDSTDIQKQNIVSLHMKESVSEYAVSAMPQISEHIAEDVSALICTYPKYFLVFLIQIECQEDFLAFTEAYTHYQAWAEKNMQIPYSDSYYQIQQMNNQLINSQRALFKSNQQLKQVLEEIREATDTIALLEHDELTALYCASAFYRNVRQRFSDNPNVSFDIIVLDIGRFKLVNEIYGRKSGDRLLQDLALFMLGLEDADHGIFARATADTFYILMPSDYHYYDYLNKHISTYLENYPLPIHIFEKIGVYRIFLWSKCATGQDWLLTRLTETLPNVLHFTMTHFMNSCL